MCGISVVINKDSGPVPEAIIQQMTSLVRHRGPDGEGYFHQGPLAMGHRRLKIIDLTNSAAQPMTAFGCVISFNGEIYNYPELKQALIEKGLTFSTHSDTEVVLAAYRQWGQDCVQHFVGMWSFCIYDPHKEILFCSRDRYGIKPLCYTDGASFFGIGSEVKQFRALPGFKFALNHETAFHFLYPATSQGNEECFFSNVNVLLPGSNLIYDLGSMTYRTEKWYVFRAADRASGIGYDEACTLFREKFHESVRLHCRADVEIGAFVSGGIDSSSIALSMQNAGEHGAMPVKTISSCFEESSFNEIRYIDAVLKKGNFQGWKIFPDIRDLLRNDLFQRINYFQDQPIANGSYFSEYELFEKAHELGLKVILDGQGPDEYLAGYHGFHEFYLKNLLFRFRLGSFTRELSAYSILKDNGAASFLTQVGKEYTRLFARKTMHRLNRAYFTPVWLNRDWFLRHYAQHELPMNPLESIWPGENLGTLTEAALYNFSLPPQLLSQDRHAMMHSVESRLPFLDHRLVEFALTLPEQYKIRKGVTKSVLRDAMKNELPELVYSRQNKLGLPGPEDRLFDNYDSIVEDQLRELVDGFPEIFSIKLIHQYEMAIKQNGYCRGLVFKSLSFLHWARAFNLHNR